MRPCNPADETLCFKIKAGGEIDLAGSVADLGYVAADHLECGRIPNLSGEVDLLAEFIQEIGDAACGRFDLAP